MTRYALPIALVPLLIALTLLLQACATRSPHVSVTVPPPKIPPLLPQHRQPPANPICLPTCSERLELDYERWRAKLMRAAPPALGASANTTR